MDPKLLDIICCPVTRQPLEYLDQARLGQLNQAIRDDKALNSADQVVSEEFSEAMKKSGGSVETKIYASHGHFSLIRRTTSWHVWPKPLLTDVLGFVDRFRLKKDGVEQGGGDDAPDRTKDSE